MPPARHYAGEGIEKGSGLTAARLCGMHLRWPGYGDAAPTLEIFSYDPVEARPAAAVNRPGYGHIAFAVDDVAAARRLVLAEG